MSDLYWYSGIEDIPLTRRETFKVYIGLKRDWISGRWLAFTRAHTRKRDARRAKRFDRKYGKVLAAARAEARWAVLDLGPHEHTRYVKELPMRAVEKPSISAADIAEEMRARMSRPAKTIKDPHARMAEALSIEIEAKASESFTEDEYEEKLFLL